MYIVWLIKDGGDCDHQSVRQLSFHDGFACCRRSWLVSEFRVDMVSHVSLRVVGQEDPRGGEALTLTLGVRLDRSSQCSGGSWIEIQIDPGKDRVHVMRDPAGLMTAFFARIAGGYLISDSVPALLECNAISRAVDFEALNEYWFLDFCIAPRTIWSDIRAVPNGHRAELPLHSGREAVYEQCWIPGLSAAEQAPLPAASAPAALRKVILEETELAMTAAPNGFVNLLSGGIDSSVVLAACHVLGRHPDYAITFKGNGDADESGLAAVTADRLGVQLEIARADASDLVTDAREVTRIWGQPYAHGSVHAMQQLLKHVPTGGILLTGDGGGEAFVGLPPRLSVWRWGAASIFHVMNSLPYGLRRNLYERFATRLFWGRAFSYALELHAARDEGEREVRKTPLAQWETEVVVRPENLRLFSKDRLAEVLAALTEKSALPSESLFARSLIFWWGCEGVYAKTWRLLDAQGVNGLGPLTSPGFFDTVKRIPLTQRGTRKQALRDAFADVLPPEVVNAPKRGLTPLNRQLLAQEADAGIAWITDGGSVAWDALFDRDTVAAFWKAHRDGKVYRSNLLYKAIIFRAWCDQWQPEISGKRL